MAWLSPAPSRPLRVEFCKRPCLYARPNEGENRALDGGERDQHPLPADRPGTVGRAAARDGRHARQLGRHCAGAERALPRAALRPARLRVEREGAHHRHRAAAGRSRGRARGQRAAAAVSLRDRRRRYHAGSALHVETSQTDRELHVLQSVHRRRSEPGRRAQRARRARRARGPAQGDRHHARQFLAVRHRRPRRLRRLPRPLHGARPGLLRGAQSLDRRAQCDASRQGDQQADHGGGRTLRQGAPAGRQRDVRQDHSQYALRADRRRAHDAGASARPAAGVAPGFSRQATLSPNHSNARVEEVAMKVKTNGITINYQIDGPDNAPCLIFSNSLVTNLAMWDEQARALGGAFRVLRYDQRGHGDTDAPAGRYPFDTLLADAIGMMDALGIKKASFAGLSMGGATALGLAQKHPDRLDRVIVCDSPCQSTPTSTQQWEERIVVAQKQGMEALVEPTVGRWFPPEVLAAKAPHVDKGRARVRATPVNGFIGCAAALADHNYAAAVGTVTRPVLFIAGEKDGVTPTAMRKLSAALAGSRYVELPGAGHISNMDQPEGFNATVAGFLRGG